MATSSLEISSDIIGARCVPLDVEVTPRMIMNYAAGIGDANPWHYADDRAEGIVAPPLMTWALTWRFSTDRDVHWGDAGISGELAARNVHYTEELRWTRPLLPGDRLHIVGEIAGLYAHRAGTVAVLMYTGTDARGDVVFTEKVGSMLRGVTCAESLPPYQAPLTPFALDAAPTRRITIPVDRLAAHRYDGCADIHNPIHTSKAFARMVGLPDIILHGTATLAYAVREIIDFEGAGDPRRVAAIGCRFTGMVFMDSTIEVQVLGSESTNKSTDVHFQVIDGTGKRAIRDGRVSLHPE